MKKLISFLLVSLMMLSVLPLSVSSNTMTDSQGIMYMKNYDGETCMVLDYEGTASDVVIPSEYDGYRVTKIYDYAFSYCTDITSVEIPDSVITIGRGAFSDCDGLTTVVLPDSVLTVENEAFSWCDNLTDIKLPDSLTAIGRDAFLFSENLTHIEIPASVTYIGGPLFSCCSNLRSIIVKEGNTVYHSSGNCLIETETKTLISGCVTSVIPDDGSVTVIGEEAFEGTALTEIVIPDGIKLIENNAFYGCDGVQSISLPESLTYIGESAFYFCSALTELKLPSSLETIEAYAFEYCSGITSVEIPASVEFIGEGAFGRCNSLSEMTVADGNGVYYSAGNCIIETATGTLASGCVNSIIPDDGSVTAIGDGAFYGCENLISIKIPSTVTEIGENAFCLCLNLTDAVLPDSVVKIGDFAFQGCGFKDFVLPESVTEIGHYVFQGCDVLEYNEYDNGLYLGTESNPYYALLGVVSEDITSCDIHNDTRIITDAFEWCEQLGRIEIPDSVICIGDNAFSRTALTNITIPDSVTHIGNEAFYACELLGNAELSDSLVSVGKSAFYSCGSLQNILLPDSLEYIGDEAFAGCDLTEIKIPASVAHIGEGAFARNCFIQTLEVSKDNSTYHSAGNCIIETDSKTLVAGCEKSVIPSDGSVEIIGNRAFDNVFTITEIDIPDTVTAIGDYAFRECNGLTEIVIPDSVTEIGVGAFENCAMLTSVTIPDSVTAICEQAFSYYENTIDVYCEAESMPEGWSNGWIYSCNANIHWGEATFGVGLDRNDAIENGTVVYIETTKLTVSGLFKNSLPYKITAVKAVGSENVFNDYGSLGDDTPEDSMFSFLENQRAENMIADAELVTPEGTFYVSTSIPDGWSSNITVYFENPEGTLEALPTEVNTENGTVTAELTECGTIVFAENGDNEGETSEPMENETSGSIDESNDVSNDDSHDPSNDTSEPEGDTPVPPAGDASDAVNLGDVNLNGEIDSLDYILLKRAFFNTFKLNERQTLNGDINRNGEIDSLDYILLKRAYFGTYKIK